MTKIVTKAQAKKATETLTLYAKQQSKKGVETGKKHANNASKAAKAGINKIKSLFK